MSQSFENQYPLFESIRCENLSFKQLAFHEQRMKASSKKLWGKEIDSVNWFSLFSNMFIPGIFKCKVYYNETQFFTDIAAYEKRSITELVIVEDNEIEYSHKYSQRNKIDTHTRKLLSHQDIILEKNGFVTDSSYANLALWDGENWVTPKRPLLKGTKRAYYLVENMLVEKDVKLKDLGKYSKISLINAMLDLGEIVVDISNVTMA
jgi:4-amino-4-deoxychorismate lyase